LLPPTGGERPELCQTLRSCAITYGDFVEPVNEAVLDAVKMMLDRADALGHKDPEYYL
jgi:hypothetical protein